jgi:hypothetical protein
MCPVLTSITVAWVKTREPDAEDAVGVGTATAVSIRRNATVVVLIFKDVS